MNSLYFLIGEGDHLTALQMAVRATGMFFITLALIKLGGMRIFGKKSAFDNIVVIMLGAVLARGIVGAFPYFSTVAAAAAMTIIHRILGWLSVKHHSVSKFVKGDHIVLYKDGNYEWKNMQKSSISEGDLLESLRLQTNQGSVQKIETALMETNGQISFIMKDE